MISFAFGAAYFLFIDDLLTSLTLEAEVAYVARYYLMTMVGVVFFISMIVPLRCLTDTAGSTSTSMKLFLMAPPVNAVFNYLSSMDISVCRVWAGSVPVLRRC